jgi:hypothetical protein
MDVMLIILGGELSSAPVAFLASMYGKQLETGSTLTMYGYTEPTRFPSEKLIIWLLR